jgi:hypothetical protein
VTTLSRGRAASCDGDPVPATDARPSAARPPMGHAGTDSADPRKTMAQTLPQRFYLLSYDLDKGGFDPVSAAYRGHLLRAAALTELILGGWLGARDGRAVRADVTPPRDRFLAEVLNGLAPGEPGHWINAVPDLAHRAETTVREQLVENGEVTVARGRVLGILPTRRITLDHPDQARQLRERIREAVLAAAGPATAQDAALAAIAVEGDVWTVFTPKERRRHRAEFTALRERFDAEVPGMRNAVLTAVVNRRAGNS